MTSKFDFLLNHATVSAVLFAMFLCGLSPALFGQNITGTITGMVIDPSGAPLPDARVVISNEATGIVTQRMTSQNGTYEFLYVTPGTYRISVSHANFKTMVQTGVILQVDKVLLLNFHLEVGSATTSITVYSEGTKIDFESGTMGQVIPTKAVEDLPTLDRNIFDLISTSTEVQVNPYALGQPTTNGGFVQSDFSISGGRFRTNEFLLDGVSIMLPQNNNYALVPTPDATQEFDVMTSSAGPQFGRSGGGVINVITKSGTNQLHGVAYDYLRNTIFNANSFFADQAGLPKAPQHFNIFGGAVGGPIMKDKTFFFGTYEGTRNPAATSGNLTTVPTAQQRQGDFSATYDAAGAPVNIYDPYSTQLVGTTYTRTQFQGNVIPQMDLDSTALKILSLLPLPNTPGVGPAQTQNYVYVEHTNTNANEWSMRLDDKLSDRDTIFGRISMMQNSTNTYGEFPGDEADGSTVSKNHGINVVMNDVLTLSATDMINLRYGFTRAVLNETPLDDDVSLTSLGFPPEVATAAQERIFPAISITGYTTMGSSTSVIRLANDINTFVAEQNLSRGRHTLVYGADVRLYNQDTFQSASPAGNYSFGPNYTQGPNAAVASATSGNAFASFLLGYGSGSIATTPALAIQNWYWALYFNDQFKVSRKLTANVGVRYDYDQPLNERHNEFATFDFNAPFPIAVPGLTGLHGVLTHPGQNGLPRGQFASYWKSWGPRIGLSYALTTKLAVRAGYGIYYSPRFGSTSGASFGTSGYGLSTSWVASLNGYTPLNPLSDPYPSGLLQTPTDEVDQLQMGQTVNISNFNNPSNTYVQQRNFGLQWEPESNWLLEADYSGSLGTHLPVPLDYNQLNPIYQSLGTALTSQVSNPFYGLVQTGTLSSKTVSESQLLKPYPQYADVSATNAPQQVNLGSSSYNSVSVKAVYRESHNVYLVVGYTTGKLMSNGSGRIVNFGTPYPPLQNNYDLHAERSLDAGDVSRRLVISHRIILPFGRGERFLASIPGALNVILGGWNTSGAFSYNTGWPLALTSTGNSGVGAGVTRPNGVPGKNAKLNGKVESRLSQYLNTAAFAVPPPYTFGNVSRTLGNVRGPSWWNYDLALQKSFPIKESWSLTFRAEAHNLTNTPYFLLPGIEVGTSTFGQVSASINQRQGQLALRLTF
jgi:Carboxypeptidase regulatory-like domain